MKIPGCKRGMVFATVYLTIDGLNQTNAPKGINCPSNVSPNLSNQALVPSPCTHTFLSKAMHGPAKDQKHPGNPAVTNAALIASHIEPTNASARPFDLDTPGWECSWSIPKVRTARTICFAESL